jgi:hypothetical protein
MASDGALEYRCNPFNLKREESKNVSLELEGIGQVHWHELQVENKR